VWRECPAADLVPGDVAHVLLGAVMPADLRLLVGVVLVDQSMLTGESMPVEIVPGGTAYAGGLVRRGEAAGQTVATGARTHFGRTAELVRTAHGGSSKQRTVLGVVRDVTILNFAILIQVSAVAIPTCEEQLLH
jgi:H+-transporting ATPase